MLKYIGGHPQLRGPCPVTISKSGDKVVIRAGFKTATIPLEAFGGIDFQRGERRSVGKAAAGAVVGTALAGPLGGIIGGAIGARAKQANTLTIPVTQGALSYNLVFEGTQADFNRLAQILYS